MWDGLNEISYIEDSRYHDCMILSDGSYISVQKRRQEAINHGIVPTIVFACKRGEKAIEIEIQGKVVGAFSHYWKSMLIKNPDVTFRDAVRLVNQTMKQKCIRQKCEVVCRADVLDMKELDTSLPGSEHMTMIFDMCRTPSKNTAQKIY